MTEIDFEKLRNKWYHDENVLYMLIEGLKYREGVFLREKTVHRCLKLNKIEFFMQNAERYHFWDEPFNAYSSLALYPNLPMFSFVIPKKRAEMDSFNERYKEYMTGYDLLIDVDNPDLELAYATTSKIKADFDDRHIPYSLVFSGKKGFHIRVSYLSFPQWMKELEWQELANLLKKFAENYRAVNMLPDIDTSVIDLRRIAKLPYSVVYPYYFVALPLSDAQFEDFSVADVSLPNLINQTDKIFKRGLLTRAGMPNNFGALIKEYTND